MQERDTLITKVMEAGGRLRVRSALNPILWLCGIITVPIVVAQSFSPNPNTWLILLAFSPVAAALIGFLFLLFADRDKLQSEEYQIRKQSLELIHQKGDPLPIDAMTAVLVQNPESPKLTDHTGDSK